MKQARRTPEALGELEEQLRYRFRERAWLVQALTHRSHSSGTGSASNGDNEQLEFLGDAILGFLVSDALCSELPDLREGKLSRIKSNLVSRHSLCRVGERLALGQYLRLGAGEEKTGGRKKQALLANAVEAVVAAIYRDGGLRPTRRFVEEFLLAEVRLSDPDELARADFKSALQEYLQGRRLPAARYETIATRGPEHRKTFTVELWVGEQRLGRGRGATKKSAEQQAARCALEQLSAEAVTERR